MPEAIFSDTPLAQYLDDTGMEDWGIEESVAAPRETDMPSIDESGLRPLVLSETSAYVRAERFRSLLRQAVNPRLSHRETARFLEQFRYAIVSSQLLEERPLYTKWTPTTNERRRALLFSKSHPWNVKLEPSYWVGGGGCVLAIAVLFSWRIKKCRAGPIDKLPGLYHIVKSDDPESATGPFTLATVSAVEGMALVLTLCVGLYLYAHSRRRLLRSLHSKALANVCIFVEANKCFDGDCVRALQSLQQTEMLDKGHHPDYRGKTASKHVRTGKALRAALTSTLHLATESLLDSIKDCFCMCSELDLQKYFEVYDLAGAQEDFQFMMNDDFVGFTDRSAPSKETLYGAASCFSTTATLKLQFRKVHFLRRALLCCLLSVPSCGDCTTGELESWTVVTDHLKSTGLLMEQLSGVITRERLLSTNDQSSAVPEHKPKSQFVELNVLAQHIAARMDLVSNTALEPAEYEQHTELLQADIAHLNDVWSKLQVTHDRSESRTELSTPVLSSNNAMWSSRDSVLSSDSLASTLRENDDYALQMPNDSLESSQVLETVAAEAIRQRSTLTRSERIRQAHAKARSERVDQNVFMRELNDVLGRRTGPRSVEN